MVSSSSATGSVGAERDLLELLEGEIASGDLAPGSRLPTEREWVARSGYSRATVRRALGLLEARGRIVRHVGRGTFVAPAAPDDASPASPAADSSPAEIMAVRLLLEPSAMRLAATAARREDFDEMERCLLGGEQHREYQAFERWDAALHRALFQATHNVLLVRMCEIANEARDQPLWGRMKRRSFTQDRCQEYIDDHRAIVEALTDRDPDAAQEAMHRHLVRVRGYLLDT